ncbi:MAG: ABC transporter permease subunit, partial [Janthinobacterium lividum]
MRKPEDAVAALPPNTAERPGSSVERTVRRAPGWSWRSRSTRALVYQAAVVVLLIVLAALLARTTLLNLQARGIRSGFDFLFDPAGFEIGESVLPFAAGDPYWRAFAVGLSNTLRVALAGIVLATVIGVLIGIGRLSRNALLRWICSAYVELFRNLPLLQLLMWYFTLTQLLPPVTEALHLGTLVYLSKSGLSFSWPVWAIGHLTAVLGAVVGVVAGAIVARRARRAFEAGEGTGPSGTIRLGILLVCTLLGWLIGGAPLAADLPEPSVFNISGGASVTPEFLAVLIGLSVYTAAFIAEIVRSGIQSVAWGQLEAADALGLPRRLTLRLVVLP